MKCYGCGVEKDLNVKEVYPYPEQDRLTTDPIPPLFTLECSSKERDPKTGHSVFKLVVVCHECFSKLDPDMWIGERCWESINAIVKFDDLPTKIDDDDGWNPARYPNLLD